MFRVALCVLVVACAEHPKDPIADLEDPATCGSCHAQHYAEWSGSMHAYASDDPVFVAMNNRGERDTAMIRLTWPTPQTIDRVLLFDRPNDLDQVNSGMLVFSDGSTISTGALPDNAQKGLEVSFEPKTVPG